MIDGKKIFSIIPARGASKGLPRKNIRKISGRPLIAWTIEEAKKSKYIDYLILSSDDEEIITIAKEYGCEVPFVRPSELARDETPSRDVILHALGTLSEPYDYVVLLQPTSPLRLVEDIDGCIKKCIDYRAPSCVSVAETGENPYWMYMLNEKGFMIPVISQVEIPYNRQLSPKTYILNGAVYIAKTDWFMQSKTFLADDTIVYDMPKERSFDIDNDLDFKICDLLLNHRLSQL